MASSATPYGQDGGYSSERYLRFVAAQPPRVYTHNWAVGDLIVWDNRCVMHRARPYDFNKPRVLQATRIAGDPATELAPTGRDDRARNFNPSATNR